MHSEVNVLRGQYILRVNSPKVKAIMADSTNVPSLELVRASLADPNWNRSGHLLLNYVKHEFKQCNWRLRRKEEGDIWYYQATNSAGIELHLWGDLYEFHVTQENEKYSHFYNYSWSLMGKSLAYLDCKDGSNDARRFECDLDQWLDTLLYFIVHGRMESGWIPPPLDKNGNPKKTKP